MGVFEGILLGSTLDVGFKLGKLDDRVLIEGFSDICRVGEVDEDGDALGINTKLGAPLIVGIWLGCPDGDVLIVG